MIAWYLVASAAAEDWTLRAAVAQALAHNLELRQEGIDAASAGAALVAAKADFGPTLSATTSATGTLDDPSTADDTFAWTLGLSQPLPSGGTLWFGGSQSDTFARRFGPDASVYSFTGLSFEQPLLDGAGAAALYAVDAARLDVRAAELEERAARERLVVDVANAYWELVAARESSRLAARSVEIATSQLADTRERFDEGFAGSGDVLQLERALGVARQSAVVAEAAESAAERTLARRMGLPLEEHPRLVPTDRPGVSGAQPDLESALAQARAGNAAWLGAQVTVESARRDFRAARNDALPDLSVSATVGWSADTAPTEAWSTLTTGAERAWGVGATLSVPLAWSGARADLERGRLSLRRTEISADAAWQNLVAQVQAALDAVRRDRARVDLAELTLKAAQAGLAADQELYREGRGSTRDVVRSLEALEEAQVDSLQAQIDLQSSLLELQRLQGTVLAAVGVE